MDELKTMDEQQRLESLNRPVEYDTTQYIVTQLGDDINNCQNADDYKSTKSSRLY